MDPKPPDENMDYKDIWSAAVDEYCEVAEYGSSQEFRGEIEKEIGKFKANRTTQPKVASSPHGKAFFSAAPDAVNFVGQTVALAFPPAAIFATITNHFVMAGAKYYNRIQELQSLEDKVRSFFQELCRREEDELKGNFYRPHLKANDCQRLCSYVKICGFIIRYSKKAESSDGVTSTGLNPSHDKEISEQEQDQQKHFLRRIRLHCSKDKQKSPEKHLPTFRKRDKANLFLEFCLGEDKIGAELNRIEELTKEYSYAAGNDNLSRTMTMQGIVEKQSEEDDLSKRCETVRKRLNIDERYKPWKVAEKNIHEKYIGGMGDWIVDHRIFNRWTDLSSSNGCSIMKLQGPEKHGKTFLCHRIIQELYKQINQSTRSVASAGSERRPAISEIPKSVAYYHFGEKGSDEKEGPSIDSALAALIWQLVRNPDNVGYLNFVAKECETKGASFSWETLLSLLTGYTQSKFFLILDGIDRSRERTAEKLKTFLSRLGAESPEKGQIRVLLSGTSTSLDDAQGLGETIDLSRTKETRQDVRLYVSSLLGDKTKSAGDKTGQDHQEPEAAEDPSGTILELLSGVTDYDLITALLGEVGDSIWADARLTDLAGRLKKGGSNALVEFQISHLNRSLSGEEIQDLNNILPWLVLPSRFWPTLEQIEDILVLNRGGQRPVKSLQNYITEKFNGLLDLKGLHISSRAEGYYRAKCHMNEDSTFQYAPRTTSGFHKVQQEIHPSEIALVKRFLANVCGDDLYQRFGFNEFFKEKGDTTQNDIDFNPVDGHIKIITTCLQSVCNQQKHDFESIREYCAKSLSWHLSELKSNMLSGSQACALAKAMPLLHQFFSERQVVESWLKPNWIADMRGSWFTEGCQEKIAQWFFDPVIINHSGMQDFPDCFRCPLTEAELLREASIVAAKGWLQDETWTRWDVKFTCQWILSFLKQNKMIAGANVLDVSSPSITDIEGAETWAKERLGISEPNRSHSLRMGMTFARFGFHHEAKEKFDIVLSSDPPLVIASQVVESYIRFTENIDAKTLLRTLRSLFHHYYDLPCDGQDELEAWHSMINRMKNLHHAAGETVEAIKICRKILEQFPQDFDAMSKMLLWMHANQQYDDMIEVLQALPLKDLVGLFRHERNTRLPHAVAFATSRSRSFRFMETCRKALQDDDNKLQRHAQPRSGPSRLWFCYALVLTWSSPDQNCEEALQLWRQMCNSPIRRLRRVWMILDGGVLLEDQARAQLAATYIQRARASKQEWITEDDRKIYFPSEPGSRAVDETSDLLLARLHHIMGRDDLAVRELSKKINLAARLLSDDIDSNDWLGYRVLAQILTRLDRDEDAMIAWTLAFGYDLETEDDHQMESNEHGTSRRCNGNCGKLWTKCLQEDLYRCKDCIDSDFDEPCRNKIQEGRFGWNECRKGHALLLIPKWDMEHAKLLREKVPDVVEWKTRVLENLKIGEE